MLSSDFVISNHLTDEKFILLTHLGVPCGAIQPIYNKRYLTHREEHELSDEQLSKIRNIYVPINTAEEFLEHRSQNFCSYTINPNYIEPKRVQSFIYRFELLTDKSMGMFDIDEICKHQIEMLENIPLTYKKLEEMKNKYITLDKEKEYIEKHKGLSESRFYELLNEDGKKPLGNYFLDKYDEQEKEEEFE